jgi:tetratricopeptide (TPR) repeat protein
MLNVSGMKLRKKLIIILIAVLIVGGGGGFGAWYWYSHRLLRVGQVIAEINQLQLKGQYSQAIQQGEKRLPKATTSERYQILVVLGSIYQNENKYDQAAAEYLQAIAADKSQIDAYVGAGDSERLAGHTQAAITFYTEAVALMKTSKAQSWQNDVGFYQSTIESLRGQQ